jgi:hypothetical protein
MAKILISELEGDALDWAAASFSGVAMREPIYASDKDLEELKIPFTMYETSYVYRNGALIQVDVSPITVTRFGINTEVGATAPSISFTDAKGRKALGSARDYFLDLAEAELEAKAAMKGSLEEFHPSRNLEQNQYMIESIIGNIVISDEKNGEDRVHVHISPGQPDEVHCCGPNLMVAVTRAFVAHASKQEWIEIPDEIAMDQTVPRESERQSA